MNDYHDVLSLSQGVSGASSMPDIHLVHAVPVHPAGHGPDLCEGWQARLGEL